MLKAYSTELRNYKNNDILIKVKVTYQSAEGWLGAWILQQ